MAGEVPYSIPRPKLPARRIAGLLNVVGQGASNGQRQVKNVNLLAYGEACVLSDLSLDLSCLSGTLLRADLYGRYLLDVRWSGAPASLDGVETCGGRGSK